MRAEEMSPDFRVLPEDGHLLRLGGWAAIFGSLMGGIGNLLHPHLPLDDDAGIAAAIAGSNAWVPIHLVIVFGIILMLGGLVALQHSLRGDLSGALARLGLAAAVAGVAVGMVLVIMDGVADPVLARAWAAAAPDEQQEALRILLASQTLNFSLASVFNILFAGLTFILFGAAMAVATVYPRWLGWVAIAAGALSIAAGIVQGMIGAPTVASRTMTIIGPTVITTWLLVIGFLQVRRANFIETGVT